MTTENTQLATIDSEPTARQLLCSLLFPLGSCR